MEEPRGTIDEAKRNPDIKQLMLKSEAVVDDVLRPQLENLQKHRDKCFKNLLDVQLLADHIELLQLQQQHQLREHERQLQQLRELRVLRAASAEEHSKEACDTDAAAASAVPESGAKRHVSRNADPVPVEALVDVGCHLFFKAVGDDVGRILVNVGFQFFLEMTLQEAAAFLRKKDSLLIQEYEYWSVKCSGVKAQIQLLVQAVTALTEDDPTT